MEIKELFNKQWLTCVKKRSVYCKVIYNYQNALIFVSDY